MAHIATTRRRTTSQHAMIGLEADANAAFRERMQVISQLVAGILHEFNTPLGALRSSLASARGATRRLMNAENDGAQADHRLRQIGELLNLSSLATERIVDTVETLSHFARVDRADVDDVDVGEVMDTALRLAGLAKSSRVRINRKYSADLRLRCRVSEVEHVLYHIFRNAKEVLADVENATLDVQADRDGDIVTVCVHDNGPGIPERTLATLFEPSRTAHHDSLGLGLSLPICRFIAQQHGGGIEAQNRADGGARFVFWIRATK